MTVRLNRDYTTYNYVKKEEEALQQGREFAILDGGDLEPNLPNGVEDANGRYIVPGAYLEYVGEDEPDGI